MTKRSRESSALRHPLESLEPVDVQEEGRRHNEGGVNATIIQRPVPIRVNAVVLHRIPRDICGSASARHHRRQASMSPISVDSSYHSSSSTSSSLSSLHRGQTLERSHHPAVIECETSDRHRHRSGRNSLSSSPIVPATELQIQQARDGLLHALAISGGATDSDAFRNALLVLQEHYTTDHNHMRATAQIGKVPLLVQSDGTILQFFQ